MQINGTSVWRRGTKSEHLLCTYNVTVVHPLAIKLIYSCILVLSMIGDFFFNTFLFARQDSEYFVYTQTIRFWFFFSFVTKNTVWLCDYHLLLRVPMGVVPDLGHKCSFQPKKCYWTVSLDIFKDIFSYKTINLSFA